MYYTLVEVPNPDIMRVLWPECPGLGTRHYVTLRNLEDFKNRFERIPYEWLFREWLQIGGIKELFLMQLPGEFCVRVVKDGARSWDELLPEMFKPDPLLHMSWELWERIPARPMSVPA